MAGELKTVYTTGKNVYCVIINATGQFWNTSGTPAFENFVAGNWASYAVPVTEKGTSGIYIGNTPTFTLGNLNLVFYEKLTGSFLISDFLCNTGVLTTDGTKEADITSLLDASNGVETGETLRQALRLLQATIIGKMTQIDANNYKFYRTDGTTIAVTVTYDATGRATITMGTLT